MNITETYLSVYCLKVILAIGSKPFKYQILEKDSRTRLIGSDLAKEAYINTLVGTSQNAVQKKIILTQQMQLVDTIIKKFNRHSPETKITHIMITSDVPYMGVTELGFDRIKKLLMINQDFLLSNPNQSTLEAVIAHEFGHIIAGDTVSSMFSLKTLFTLNNMLITDLQMAICFKILYSIVQRKELDNDLAILSVIWITAIFVREQLLPTMRAKELNADKNALQYLSNNKDMMIKGLTTISQPSIKKEQNDIQRSSKYGLGLFTKAYYQYQAHTAEHPSLDIRIKALNDITDDMTDGMTDDIGNTLLSLAPTVD
jgi:hypothetical protein